MTVGYFLGKCEKARFPEFCETRGGVGCGRLLLFLERVFLGCLSELQADELPQDRAGSGPSLVSGHSTYMQILYHRVRRGQKIAGKFGDTSMSERGSVRYGRNTGNTIPAVVDIKS